MLVKSGQKWRARQLRDGVIRKLRQIYASPQQVMVRAVTRVSPLLEVKSTRFGGKKVPVCFCFPGYRRKVESSFLNPIENLTPSAAIDAGAGAIPYQPPPAHLPGPQVDHRGRPLQVCDS